MGIVERDEEPVHKHRQVCLVTIIIGEDDYASFEQFFTEHAPRTQALIRGEERHGGFITKTVRYEAHGANRTDISRPLRKFVGPVGNVAIGHTHTKRTCKCALNIKSCLEKIA